MHPALWFVLAVLLVAALIDGANGDNDPTYW